MNKDYQHLLAENQANTQTGQQKFLELQAENLKLQSQIIQLSKELINQRQQWSEEHFKLQERIEELQNYVQGLIQQIASKQSIIEKLEMVKMQNSHEVETLRLLYNDVLQQLIKIEGKKESIVKKMKVACIEEVKYCSILERKSMNESSQDLLKSGDQEEIEHSQLGILSSKISIENNLHKLQAQLSQEIKINDPLLQICSQPPKFSLLNQLKQLKTSQTIPKNMYKHQSQSSNTSFYFQYSNNIFENKSRNSLPKHLHSRSQSQKSTNFEPKQQNLSKQPQQESCNWQQMLSFFLGGMWSGACMMWMIGS